MENRAFRAQAVAESAGWHLVRCPACNRLAAEAAPGSRLRVKCVRCGRMFAFTA